MRYAFSGDIEIAGRNSFDVLIIGTGIAGLYTALHIDKKLSCCILTKESVEISNSWLAQGGIAAAISTDDTPDLHYDDTLIAGAGLCDSDAVRVLVEEGPDDIRTLVGMSVPFDLNDEGFLQITKEGGHRKRRIVHAGGDATGRETVKSLARLVATRSNVSFMGHSFFVDVLTEENKVTGALVIGPDGHYHIIDCPNIVIATGGVGQVYLTSTNPAVATGDGLAAAMRAGVIHRGLEFIQFHPTGLWDPKREGQAFLISEAVRGEGGLLKNAEGERFMLGKHELNELAPRDIVARGIVRELERSGADHAYVDITECSKEYLSNRFPTIYNECLSRDIDISRDWIPVCPVQHYLIGGITTDMAARTTIDGLYACGEAASTGVHGANRLASNSMLECLVFGRRAALDINSRLEKAKSPVHEAALPHVAAKQECEADFRAMRKEIQHLMNNHGFVIRTESGMNTALERIKNIKNELENSFFPGREYVEMLNLATIAVTILEAALARKESVGAHYRED